MNKDLSTVVGLAIIAIPIVLFLAVYCIGLGFDNIAKRLENLGEYGGLKVDSPSLDKELSEINEHLKRINENLDRLRLR